MVASAAKMAMAQVSIDGLQGVTPSNQNFQYVGPETFTVTPSLNYVNAIKSLGGTPIFTTPDFLIQSSAFQARLLFLNRAVCSWLESVSFARECGFESRLLLVVYEFLERCHANGSQAHRHLLGIFYDAIL